MSNSLHLNWLKLKPLRQLGNLFKIRIVIQNELRLHNLKYYIGNLALTFIFIVLHISFNILIFISKQMITHNYDSNNVLTICYPFRVTVTPLVVI